MTYKRFIQPELTEALGTTRAVALVGARQTGKTWLAKNGSEPGRLFVSLDDISNLERARYDPQGFIQALPTPVTIDEIMRALDILLPIKQRVDNDDSKGQYILTGSANIFQVPRLADSLAGRLSILELYPLTQAEIEQGPPNVIERLFEGSFSWKLTTSVADIAARIARGGYPEAVLLDSNTKRAKWMSSYLSAVIQRDIHELSALSDSIAVGRVLAIVAARSASLLNIANLASDVEIPKSSVQRYLALLQQLCLIWRLPAWSENRSRRLTKLPKIFVDDSGLATHLNHLDTTTLCENHNALGPLLESFVANELRRHSTWSSLAPQIYHYRTADGSEVDFILESKNGRRIAIEVKSKATISRSDYRSLLTLAADPTMHLERGYIFYAGDAVIPLKENFYAVPISVLWS